jgi:uncharacterized protein (UPF0548 family)
VSDCAAMRSSFTRAQRVADGVHELVIKYAPNGFWGVRGDCRLLVMRSKDDAPACFGRKTLNGHRIYGAVIINVGR